MIRFRCPHCPALVKVELPHTPDAEDQIEAWCATKHPKPVRMERVEVGPNKPETAVTT